MKDPAVLFYFQDFLVGTEFMTDDEVGKYIRILCHQADKGALTEVQLKRICRCNQVPGAIIEKLKQDENGNYYQQRMKIEREKRVSYSDSRRKNRESKKEDMNNICESYEKHMENENENENINEDIKESKEEKLKKREIQFKSEVYKFDNYPTEMFDKFCNYWTEPNKSKTKMRFELEKVFDIKRRLATWATRDKTFIHEIQRVDGYKFE